MANKNQLESQVTELQQKLAVEQQVNERMKDLVAKQSVQTQNVKRKVVMQSSNKTTFDGEKVVCEVYVGAKVPTKKGTGYMVNFNALSGKGKNYRVFIKTAWMNKLVSGKLYPVTEHLGKTSGQISHAIHIGRKATRYAKAR